ncbi:MAG: hypothetical protein RL631_1013 [Pseudomonadota bacterium]|jgi:hypothetical protein
MLSCKVSQPINSALNIKLFRNLCQTNKDRSGSVDLNRYTPIDKCHGAGLKRCRVVHGGGRRLATNDRRGGQLGAHRRFHLNGHYISQDYPEHLRRIRFKDPQTQQTLVFLTNNTSLPPLTIAALYKSRWQVELFFKWIKQHLRIKKFWGNSENAVKTQIWCAVSTYVLIAIVKKELQLNASLYTLLQLLLVSVFEKTEALQALQVDSNPNHNNDNANHLNLFNF